MCSKRIKTLASVPKSSWRPVFGDALLLAYTVKTFALVWSHSSSAAVCVCGHTAACGRHVRHTEAEVESNRKRLTNTKMKTEKQALGKQRGGNAWRGGGSE